MHRASDDESHGNRDKLAGEAEIAAIKDEQAAGVLCWDRWRFVATTTIAFRVLPPAHFKKKGCTRRPRCRKRVLEGVSCRVGRW